MKTVHLMGIGGSGMASLAGMFVESGWSVRGSDEKIYPPASVELADLNVSVLQGFRAENLYPKPDLVVVGNVISKTNPEAEALLKSDIPYTSMAQALADPFLKDRAPIVIAGTHGKTTTSSLFAWILDQAGLVPGFFVGGILINFQRGYRIGSGTHFVVEGDEYDTAFFEKTPKFVHYRPAHAILTSMEFDHADIYRDFAHVREQFETFVSLVPEKGILVAWGDDPEVRSICCRRKKGRTIFYGEGVHNDWWLTNMISVDRGMSFDVLTAHKKVAHVAWSLLGKHNCLNALGCMAMAKALGVSLEKIQEAMQTFQGVKRRQEFLAEVGNVLLYDDFAHHPTAISETLAAFEPLSKRRNGKLWAIFEPRSNTVRRKIFQDVLPKSFAKADEVILAPVYAKKDGLTPKDLLSTQEVARDIQSLGKKAYAAATYDEIVLLLTENVRKGDVVIFMSNGNFSDVPQRVLEALRDVSMDSNSLIFSPTDF